MFNDTMKIALQEMAKSLQKDEAYVYNNFNIVNRFKLLDQNVEIMVIANGDNLGIVVNNQEPYGSWENTPVFIIPDSLKGKYYCDPDKKFSFIASDITVEMIDDVLKANKSTYVGTIYRGKHESDEYIDALPVREITFTISVTPGIFK